MPKVTLKIKVLIPVTVMIIATIAVALVIVNHVVRGQVLVSVANELRKAKRVFQELQERERQLLLERAWVTAEAPHLKAAVDTGDSTTVQRVTDEMFSPVSGDVLIVTNRVDQILAQHGAKDSEIVNLSMDSLTVQDERADGTIGLMRVGDQMFRVVSVPIIALDELSGVFVLGKVILGKSIDRAYIESLRSLVDCEIAFVHRQQVLFSTFGDFQLGSAASRERSWMSGASDTTHTLDIDLGGEEFLIERAGQQGNFVLLQSVDQAFKSLMQPIEKTMLFVGLFAILAAILISSFVSHEIVTPVKKLVKATDAITSGDYDHPITVGTRDEISDLAQKFDEMRRSLQQKMAQLRQQNLELEQALKKLEATQEELLRTEKLATTGKITAQLSHELNNPIHNIQGCLEAAQKKIAQHHSGREFIDLAYGEVLRISKLIHQMLDFYRPQANSKENVDINKIVQDTLQASEKLFQEKHIRKVAQFWARACELTASPDQLKQVFLNLTLNAVDAMPRGGVLRVSTHRDNHAVSVVFEDSGGGIAPQDLNQIFDAFFTTKAKASGVGLGLTVSYGIVHSHGGKILVESKVNEGSKFTVQLPL